MRLKDVASGTKVIVGFSDGEGYYCGVDTVEAVSTVGATVVTYDANGVLLGFETKPKVAWSIDTQLYGFTRKLMREHGCGFGYWVDNITCILPVNIPDQKCIECGISLEHQKFDSKVICVVCKACGELDALEG